MTFGVVYTFIRIFRKITAPNGTKFIYRGKTNTYKIEI